MKYLFLFLSTIPVFWCPDAFADTTTDAAQAVAQLLSQHGPADWDTTEKQTIHHSCPHGHNPPDCDESDETKLVTVHHHETLTASNISILAFGSIQFSSPTTYEVPDQVTSDGFTYYNCDNTNSATQTENLTVSFQRSASLSVSHQITNTSGGQVSFQWKPIEAVTIGGQLSVSGSVTNGTTQLSSTQSTVTRTHSVTYSVAARTGETIGVLTWPIVYQAKYATAAILDADLSNGERLSSLFSAADRTFNIEGTIQFTDAAQAVGFNYQVPLDMTYCPKGTAGISVAHIVHDLAAERAIARSHAKPKPN